jgi:hypothetical protein
MSRHPAARGAPGCFCVWVKGLRACSIHCKSGFPAFSTSSPAGARCPRPMSIRGDARGPKRPARSRRGASDVVRGFTRQGEATAPSAPRWSSRSPRARWSIKIVHDATRRDARLRKARADQPERASPPVADPDGRPPGLGQDHHHRQDRQAACQDARQAQGADGLARHAPSGRAGAARQVLGRAERASTRSRSLQRPDARSRSPSAPCQAARRRRLSTSSCSIPPAGIHIDEALTARRSGRGEATATKPQ